MVVRLTAYNNKRATIVSVESYKITHCLRIDETARIVHAQRTFSDQAMTGMVLRKRPKGLKGALTVCYTCTYKDVWFNAKSGPFEWLFTIRLNFHIPQTQLQSSNWGGGADSGFLCLYNRGTFDL